MIAKSRFTTQPNLQSPHDLFGQMSVIFQSLRVLSIAMVRQNLCSDDQYVFTRGLYITEYKLLIILDATDPLDNNSDIALDRNSHIYGSCRLAAYLYLYMVLRELPSRAEIVKTVARRLKVLLEGEDGNLLGVWREDMHLLLWICSMGAMMREDEEEGKYFVKTAKRVVKHLALASFEEYKKAVGEVCWIECKCWEGHLFDLWNAASIVLSINK